MNRFLKSSSMWRWEPRIPPRSRSLPRYPPAIPAPTIATFVASPKGQHHRENRHCRSTPSVRMRPGTTHGPPLQRRGHLFTCHTDESLPSWADRGVRCTSPVIKSNSLILSFAEFHKDPLPLHGHLVRFHRPGRLHQFRD